VTHDTDGNLVVRITRQESLITRSRTAMRYVLQPLVRINSEPERVGNLATVIQHASSFERIDQRRTKRLRIKHCVPLHPIADGREHTAVSINIHERHIESPWSIASARVCLS